MKTTFIYALIDPRTNEIRYIGKSDNPENRLKGHIKQSKNGGMFHVNKWIRKLLKLELVPLLQIIEECEKENWKEREQYWIKHYRDSGCSLTNLTEGGDGLVNPSKSTLRKMSKNAIKQFAKNGPNFLNMHHTEETVEVLREKTLKQMKEKGNPFSGKHHTEEWKEKQSKLLGDGRMAGKNNPMYGRKGKLAPAFGRTGDKHPMYNKHHKTESKEKTSKSLREYWIKRKERENNEQS